MSFFWKIQVATKWFLSLKMIDLRFCVPKTMGYEPFEKLICKTPGSNFLLKNIVLFRPSPPQTQTHQ